MHLYSRFCIETASDSTPLAVPSSNAAQAIPFDANGDLSVDLLGIPSGSSTLSVWRNVYNESDPLTEMFTVYVRPFA